MNKLPKAILPVILVSVLLVTGCQPVSEPPGGTSSTTLVEGSQVGDLAPDFQLQNLNGELVSLSELRGRPVMLNFWATWCPPCRAEMPYIQAIYEAWTGKSPGVIVLGINMRESPSKVREFMQSNNLSFPVLLDIEKNISTKYNVSAIPTTFFIDADGIIQAMKVGAFSSVAEIEKDLGKVIP